jgi:hypothetical protein
LAALAFMIELLLCTRNVSGHNLGPETSYRIRGSFVVTNLRNVEDTSLKSATISFLSRPTKFITETVYDGADKSLAL